ncbi:hypothetical protein [Candidatus Protochlamydia phocaeensis]|uniref:hypothetical protein n=1 Tax=Candidatus Protochlamydia phocaeensis TaxID=1414722 RepID=UPI000839799A|nr:hypothetical protein [Candidatus Protochlamydia phocaeensis]
MTSLKHRYQELVALTQIFLLREHPLKDKPFCLAAPSNHSFFQAGMKRSLSSAPYSKDSPPPQPIALNRPLPGRQPAVQSPSPDPQPQPGPILPSPDPLPPVNPPEHPFPDPLPPTTPPQSPSPDPQPPQIVRDKRPLQLEPLSATSFPTLDLSFKQTLRELFPHYPLCDNIPDDKIAKKVKNAWYQEKVIPPIIILSFNDQDKHLTFLKNVAQAISLRLAPARVLSGVQLEKEKQWETILREPHLRLVIASDYGLYLQPGLMKHYREVPKQAKHFLHQTPLLLLSDLNLYLKDPQLKALLWRAICKEFTLPHDSHTPPAGFSNS